MPTAPLVSAPWRDLLESAPPGPATDYHLGIAQWHAGDRAQAVRSWERALAHGTDCRPLYCLAVAEETEGETARAAQRYAEALACVTDDETGPEHTAPLLPALVRAAVPALLAAGRTDEAAAALDRIPAAARTNGRFALLTAQVALARGDAPAARAVFDRGFEVPDLREGDETLSDTWYAIADRLTAGTGPVTPAVHAKARAEHPLPERYEFRMREV